MIYETLKEIPHINIQYKPDVKCSKFCNKNHKYLTVINKEKGVKRSQYHYESKIIVKKDNKTI